KLVFLFPISEKNDESSLQEKDKGDNSFQGNSDKENVHYEDDKNELPPSNLQKDDGNSQMVDVHEDPEIPYGMKYNKTWLMNSILSHCCVPFTPIDFHYIKNRAQFFVQDASTASALKDVNCKICDEENQKISIFVNPCTEPNTLQNKFTPEKMEKLMLTMNKRYDVSQQALDLQKLRFDPDLMEHDIDMILNRRQCMFATLQIIERNFPELLSLNLCNNKLYWLDGLSDIVEKAPQVKILNLSKNELRTSKELIMPGNTCHPSWGLLPLG
uniref:Nuclear RNA export factor 2-like n=1 Tax=Marmota marmota marmota TaxID=9994 RepID=A0A8C5Z9K3_MARMA